jgi:hypothetical protein
MKTVQEYMNDPRLLNDPDMAGALEPIRELCAIPPTWYFDKISTKFVDNMVS